MFIQDHIEWSLTELCMIETRSLVYICQHRRGLYNEQSGISHTGGYINAHNHAGLVPSLSYGNTRGLYL